MSIRLTDQDKGKIIAKDLEKADSFWTRFRGLMFRRNFSEDKALLFTFPEERSFQIHTFFVFFSIDLVYLDENFEVIEIEKDVSPFRGYTPEKKANNLVEFRSGKVEEENIELGDKLEVIE